VIYGSIAIIPIFLIWLYLLWVVILLSVEISCVWQTGWDDRNENFKGSLFDTFKSIFELYLFIAEKYADNSGGASLCDIEMRSPDRKSSEYLISSLEKAKLVHRVENGKVIFIPSAPPHTALSSDVIKIISGMKDIPENKLSDVYKTFFPISESSINSSSYKYINDILVSLKRG
jgi:membrane protein